MFISHPITSGHVVISKTARPVCSRRCNTWLLVTFKVLLVAMVTFKYYKLNKRVYNETGQKKDHRQVENVIRRRAKECSRTLWMKRNCRPRNLGK